MSPDDVPFVRSILHPTDFSEESNSAFVHALAVAVIRQAELTLLHAGSEPLEGEEWEQFPKVRETLEGWNLLEPGSQPADVFPKLGFRINKIDAPGRPVEAAMEFLEDAPADLLVLATSGRDGLARFFRPSTAEQIAAAAGIKTLFVTRESRGFVTSQGDIHLRRILVPVAEAPDARPALLYAARSTILAAGEPVELIAFHVGERMPDLALPEAENCSWKTVVRSGGVVDEIAKAAHDLDASVIFMSTDGRNTLAEYTRGSHTEQVVRRAPCPVIAIPQD